jgi:tetratricopeptide (TPR) repeat protein
MSMAVSRAANNGGQTFAEDDGGVLDDATVELLRERRRSELARLAEATRARDLLEARLARLAHDLSEAKGKIAEREKRLSQLEQRAGGVRFTRDGDAKDGAHPSSATMGALDKLWLRRTIKMARAAHRARRLGDAQILFDAALLVRDTPSLWTELAHVLREQKLFDGAQAAYERALQSDPDNAENLFLAGYCAEYADRKDVAARFYDKALARNPKLVDKFDHLRDFNARLFD